MHNCKQTFDGRLSGSSPFNLVITKISVVFIHILAFCRTVRNCKLRFPHRQHNIPKHFALFRHFRLIFQRVERLHT